jgi:hypothetical protein
MPDLANVAGTWWSYADADPTLLGVVVAALAAAAVGFTAARVLARGRTRRR